MAQRIHDVIDRQQLEDLVLKIAREHPLIKI